MHLTQNQIKSTTRIFYIVLFVTIARSAIYWTGTAHKKGHPHKTNTTLVRDTTGGVMDNQTKVVVEAANAFLQSLSAEQKEKVQFDFIPQEKATAASFKRTGMPGGPGGPGGPDNDKNRSPRPPGDSMSRRPPDRGGNGNRGGGMTSFAFAGEQYGRAVWSNFPVSDVPRPGIPLGNLDAKQRAAAMQLLQVSLSNKGYQKVLEIMGSDQALADGGTNFTSGTDSYLIAIFGKPGTTNAWMLEFGGHHLGLNIVIAGSKGVLTPTLTGAQPAVYNSNGKTVRVLAQENDKAFGLLHEFDTSQLKKAILNYRIGDLVMGPGKDGETIVPEGLQASSMNQKQKSMLLDLVAEWAGIINEAYSAAHMEEIKATLDDSYFAWSGPTTHEPGKNGAAYYRIQGPKVFIEFSPQGVGGDLTMHVHTIFRDPTNEYGKALTAK